jgi:ActR/RegA family two-component response regulator
MAFPGTYNFNYYKGDTYQFVIRPKNADGSAFDLTGYSAIFTIATARGSGATQYTATASVDTVNNLVTCTISTTVGSSIPTGSTYVYDVQISNLANIVHTLLTGTISITEQVTGA